MPPLAEKKGENPLRVYPATEGGKGGVVALDSTQKEAFAEHLLRSKYPIGWKAPRLETYDGLETQMTLSMHLQSEWKT